MTQTTTGTSYPLSHTYTLANHLRTLTLPSGRQLAWNYDAAGRVQSITGTLAGVPTTYASNLQYAAHGAVSQSTLGNNLVESWNYNARLQPWTMTLGTAAGTANRLGLSWGHCTSAVNLTANGEDCAANNGNLLAQRISVPGVAGWDQHYFYDGVSRLTGVSENAVGGSGTTLAESYGYDQPGNLWWTGQSGLPPYATSKPYSSTWYSNGRNRAVPPGAVETNHFDAAGNRIVDGTTTLAYDAEGRLRQAGSPANATYVYDGEGRRVQATVGGVTTTFVYSAQGELVADYQQGGAPPTSGTQWLTADHLGSTRAVTDAGRVVVVRHDPLPFGEDVPAGSAGRTTALGYLGQGSGAGPRQQFTGKERDNETGLDYFGERYFSGAQGRFTSPDALIMKKEWLADPQRWNRYAYVRNNSLRYIDPNGEDLTVVYSTAGLSDETRSGSRRIKRRSSQRFKLSTRLRALTMFSSRTVAA